MKTIVILTAILALTLCQDYCDCQPNLEETGQTKGLDPTSKACVDPKVTNCEVAVSTDASKCAQCKADHIPDVVGTATKCTPIATADKIPDCKYYSADKKCVKCVSGKGLGSDGKCAAGVTNCSIYDGPSTALKCVGCDNQYKLSSDSKSCETNTIDNCITVDSTTPTAPKCVVCKQGYYPSSGKCAKVSTVNNCRVYDLTKDACVACNLEYHLSADKKTCTKYTIAKCVNSSVQDKCDYCDGVAPNSGKTECSETVTVDSNCAGYGVDKKCGSCKEGYGMDASGKCTNKCPTDNVLGDGSNAQIISFSVLLIALVAIIL